ncbi:glucose-6-phosphate dehydrogenase [Campylobacter hepaticus]|uniref:Glucose-6-phosphate 1-dehydrogenase n=1 Tax=Campylobacter hepaticus TaxID=1813019 RepID=A0A6A7JUA7_9BACT|nr:glucose-6-phosphate dehydrogenase [Campylobacter hepaticus]AXP08688.1 glucose-6-phosphate dehydrogenase [Campylobacter hepaticus]MCZ0772533.1 glucose-6-phosphate dehydrogenase [Campylobacter hepaticus]MCZ0774001.1 glucose-6-phosphate dehydrogenase [Campylobacter hepaticus]MCZ0775253.1 glucose-6-phosphate dehydrogenase [Campylobacter hepaticus]MDX2324015.1 glucose-6-phosphate dehydrogenase [Campylobacter hepaticus]
MQNFRFVLFGATGDLAMRKIFPSLYQAFLDDLLPSMGRIIATSRSSFNTEQFIGELNNRSKIHIKNYNDKKWEEFTHIITYLSINLNNMEDFYYLQKELGHTNQNIVIYFSVSPEFFMKACKNLTLVHLNQANVKIILEKPLGMDLQSCQAINNEIAKYYNENQIYRIDHYLGKESIQNLLFLRSYNPIFTSLWNKEHIDYIEISVFETLGVESRGEFYDNTGALRDMVQNHILQILSLVAMKIPQNFDAQSIREAKLNLLKNLKPLSDEDMKNNVIRAQYIKSGEFKAYLAEDNVKNNSQTETFVAIKAELLEENWEGVPFYIRTGKRMADSFAQIVIYFKNKELLNLHPNKLIIRLQPDNEISLNLKVKKIGKTMEYEEKNLILNLNNSSIMQPYERLILDAIEGNQTSFNHKEELEAAWIWIDPILENWKANKTPLYFYLAGSWGPKEVFDFIKQDGHEWHNY